jgi:agmatine deiminase
MLGKKALLRKQAGTSAAPKSVRRVSSAAGPQPTPRSLGYRMPAEWERHAATWLAWPHNRSDWPGKFEAIPWVFADIVRHLARVEDVQLIVASTGEKQAAREVLTSSHVETKRVKFHVWPTNRIWTRDSGPIFIRNASSLALTHWRFNAWAKYSDWKDDCQLPARIAQKLKLKSFTPMLEIGGKPRHVVLEGGSIDVNGHGLMLTTEECLLSRVQQRNPGLKQNELEKIFADYLGIEKVIWLGRGIRGDDTHGHVDDISRFVTPDTVLTVVERSRSDANYEPLQENLRRLRAATDLEGGKLQIVELPLPRPILFRGRRLPASYANFYIANNLVLVPTFNDPNDRLALNILGGLFPGREVIGIHCGDFIWGLGAIHCMTQQQPA